MNTILFFAAFGLLISKPFRTGLFSLFGSIIVFSIVILIGLIFNLIYPIYMAAKAKDFRMFFSIWWRLISGTFQAAGDIMANFALDYDELGNVWGEWIEDAITTEENTKFGEAGISVSASIGELQNNKKPIFERGKKLSKLLNVVFQQTRHASGAWEKYEAIREIDERNLLGKKK